MKMGLGKQEPKGYIGGFRIFAWQRCVPIGLDMILWYTNLTLQFQAGLAQNLKSNPLSTD